MFLRDSGHPDADQNPGGRRDVAGPHFLTSSVVSALVSGETSHVTIYVAFRLIFACFQERPVPADEAVALGQVRGVVPLLGWLFIHVSEILSHPWVLGSGLGARDMGRMEQLLSQLSLSVE